MHKIRKKEFSLLRLLRLFAAISLFASLALPGLAANNAIITGTVTFTNALGPSNGATITINGTALTFTNSVVIPSAQVLTNGTATGATTNLFNELSDFPANISGLSLSYGIGGTNLVLTTFVNGNLTVLLSTAGTYGFGTFATSTNFATNAYVVRVPITVESPGFQTNIASLLVSALENSTNVTTTGAYFLTNFDSLSGNQTITGNKTFNTGTVIMTNAPALNHARLFNATNTGNAFSSYGGAANAEIFGAGAGTISVGQNSTAVGAQSEAELLGDSAFGYLAFAFGGLSTAIGASSQAQATNSTALGYFASANYANSTAIGYSAATTSTNQVMLGSAGVTTVVNNTLNVGANLAVTGGVTSGAPYTNLVTSGTNFFPAGADISFTRLAITSLANGNNADVPVGANVFCEVSGPSGAFTINGIAGGRDGKFIILVNRTGQTLTIANDSGVEPTAANRIYTSTGANVVAGSSNCALMLIYDAAVTHWILLNLQ